MLFTGLSLGQALLTAALASSAPAPERALIKDFTKADGGVVVVGRARR